MRVRLTWLAALALVALLAGCASAPSGATSTPPLPTATIETEPTATAAPAPPASTTFTCLAATTGAGKTFSDSATGLTFTYPASWTEKDCERITAAGGASQTLLIGNVFFVSVNPRNGMTIQQWVAQVEGDDETVTLTPLTVAHAVAAVRVNATATGQPAQPPRFLQTMAIIAGTQSFYEVHGIVAQMSMTDTMPNQPVTSLLASFDVP